MNGAQTLPDLSIFLIGDSRFLLRLVSANLAPLAVEAILLGHGADESILTRFNATDIRTSKLLILALSRSSNEPVVVLAQAGLAQFIGVVPLLIISDRPFMADPARNIFHLPFPFGADALQQSVTDLLARPVRPEATKRHVATNSMSR